MKKAFLTFALMLIAAVSTASGDTYVYICTGSKSVRFHKTPTCRGLNNCQGTITKITLEDARKMGRTPCKICH